MSADFSLFKGTTNSVCETAGYAPPTLADILRSMETMKAALPPRTAKMAGLGRPFAAIDGAFSIVEDRYMVETVEDWSDVRSPSRASRRRRQGHQQRIRYASRPKPDIFQVGNTLIMHPVTATKVRAKLSNPSPPSPSQPFPERGDPT